MSSIYWVLSLQLKCILSLVIKIQEKDKKKKEIEKLFWFYFHFLLLQKKWISFFSNFFVFFFSFHISSFYFHSLLFQIPFYFVLFFSMTTFSNQKQEMKKTKKTRKKSKKRRKERMEGRRLLTFDSSSSWFKRNCYFISWSFNFKFRTWSSYCCWFRRS